MRQLTVRELIAKLQTVDGDAPVAVSSWHHDLTGGWVSHHANRIADLTVTLNDDGTVSSCWLVGYTPYLDGDLDVDARLDPPGMTLIAPCGCDQYVELPASDDLDQAARPVTCRHHSAKTATSPTGE